MTAGANVHGYPGYAQTCTSPANCAVPSLVEILDGCPGSPAVTIGATPGTGWTYSGGGYEIAESLIGDVMGMAYGDFVQAKVLAALEHDKLDLGRADAAGFPERGRLRLPEARDAGFDPVERLSATRRGGFMDDADRSREAPDRSQQCARR